MKRAIFALGGCLLLSSLASTVSGVARASASEVVVSGGNARALIDIDAARRVTRRRLCAGDPCTPTQGGDAFEMAVPAGLELELAAARVASVAIGDGRTVAHVVVPSKGGERAWEAVIPASGEPVFAGATGYTTGQDGERSGSVVRLLPQADGTHVVILADIREDVRLCGQKVTPLAPRGLEPKTMTLRGATMQRLSPEERAAARRVVATASGTSAPAPLARVLRVAGSSAAEGQRLADGDAQTVWKEERPSDGRGEFVVLRAPPEVPIDRFSVTIAPPQGGAGLTAPRTFFLMVGERIHQVVLPEDATLHPGSSYEIPLPEPVRVGCVALVLDESYAKGPHPEVAVAELTAYTSFDHAGATLDEVVKVLAGGGARAEAAAAVLKRAGPAALAPLTAHWPTLDASGRALAVDVAASAPACDASAELLTRALADSDREVERKARGKLERCGRTAAPALEAAVRGEDAVARGRAAPLFALVAPADAARPLADVVGAGDPRSRAVLRAAFAHASRSLDKAALASILSDPARPRDARVELLRAAAPRLGELGAAAAPIFAALYAAPEPMASRYLLLEPLVALVGHAPWADALFLKQIEAASEWPVRARAAELATGHAGLRGALARAVDDPQPRVREAALRSLAAAPGADAQASIERRLASDPWTFVRVAAVLALSATPPSAATDERLLGTLKDAAPKVRGEGVAALGRRRVVGAGDRLEARAKDPEEDIEVRRSALLALGALCDRRRVGYLTDVARRLASPVGPESDIVLGVAAVTALSGLHPPDLAQRLAPLQDRSVRPEVRRVAAAALAEPAACK